MSVKQWILRVVSDHTEDLLCFWGLVGGEEAQNFLAAGNRLFTLKVF